MPLSFENRVALGYRRVVQVINLRMSEDSWPTLGQALRDSIASNEVEPYVDPYEAYDGYDSTEEYERWLTHLDNGGAVHPDDRE